MLRAEELELAEKLREQTQELADDLEQVRGYAEHKKLTELGESWEQRLSALRGCVLLAQRIDRELERVFS